jgi:hypothetical protein
LIAGNALNTPLSAGGIVAQTSVKIKLYPQFTHNENKSTRSGECFHLFCLALARRLLCAMRSLQVSEVGDIEQDASIIILLWNLDNEDKTRKGLKVDKNRQGELGKIVYRFDGNEMRFQETEEELKRKDGFKTVRTPTPFD